MSTKERADQKTWRLISYAEHDAATNMAVDEAILETHIKGMVPPTVRLYGWKPAAVSIGYAQTLDADVVSRIRAAGLDLVRRPTGGRAVLHMFDLTYAFVGTAYNTKVEQSNADDHAPAFLSSSITAAYKQICQGLIAALEMLGVNTELGASDSSYRQLQDCFLSTTTADLHHRGKKLVGSAQLRRGQGVLQHGSLLLNQDQRMMDQLLRGEIVPPPDSELPARHANLYEIAGMTISLEELESAMKSGFERAFSVALTVEALSAEEQMLTNQLREKYLGNGEKLRVNTQRVGA